MTDIIISIVTYKNNFAQLQKVIQSVLNTNLNIKLFISDNSPDQSIKQICQDSRVEYIFNQSNIGFGAGHNLIIKKVWS
ncbi:MAG: glycosyltransferase [Leptospiraceae bacterium]|nr:glycosyltransferase [Leptospiraceae bacterium]